MDTDTMLQRAIAALKAGRKAEARRLLEAILVINERHEQAWLWLSGAVDSDEERIVCLENVLAINPANLRARQGLAVLKDSRSMFHIAPLAATSTSENAEAPKPAAGRAMVADYRVFIGLVIALVLILLCVTLGVAVFAVINSFK